MSNSNTRPEMERITTPELAEAFIDEQLKALREQIGTGKVLLALSGGVDSSVVAALLIKAVGKQLECVPVSYTHLVAMGEEPLLILGALSYQMRRLYAARLAQEERLGRDFVVKRCV